MSLVYPDATLSSISATQTPLTNLFGLFTPGANPTATTVTVNPKATAPVADTNVTSGKGSLGVLQTLDHLLNPNGGLLGAFNVVQEGEVLIARLAGVGMGITLVFVGLAVVVAGVVAPHARTAVAPLGEAVNGGLASASGAVAGAIGKAAPLAALV
jgi:hypothetical protein